MKSNPCFFILLCFVFSFTGNSQTTPNSDIDSLDGFDREAVKLNLLSNYVLGQENLSCIARAERAFKNTKYNLVTNPITTPDLQGPTGHRTIGGTNTTLNAPCVNEGFESTMPGAYTGAANATAISSWSLSSYIINSGFCAPTNPTYAPGSSKAWVISTPIFNLPAIGMLPNSPLGGNKVVQLNDYFPTGLQTRLRQTFPVTNSNNLFEFAFAGAWEGGGHDCCVQSGFRVRLYDCNGIELTCTSFTFVTPGVGCPIGSGVTFSSSVVNGVPVSWTNWQARSIDLSPYIGSCVTIEVVSSDCTAGGHYGVTYFDSRCGTQTFPGMGLPGGGIPPNFLLSYCAGSNQAILQGPAGYNTYQWTSPTTGVITPANGGTAQTYTVVNPVPNSVYSLHLTTINGCHYTASYTIVTTNVVIAGTGTSSACSSLATNGTATVVAGGSSVGYNYSWTNASGVQVGTTSVLSNVPPGNYTVNVTAPSFPGCGTANASVTIPAAPVPVSNILKYYCGATAYLQSPQPGTNFNWYDNISTLIPAAQGGATQSYTVTAPVNGQMYKLGYTTIHGCRDSIIFTLTPSVGGYVFISNSQSACAGTSLGNATISLNPVTPYSNYSFTVSSAGATPFYSTTINTPSYTYTATNLFAGGAYSVNAFDGSCFYSTSFNTGITAPGFNYSLALPGPAVCSPTIFTVGVNILNSSSYNYSWSPGLAFVNPASQNATVLPSLIPAWTSSVMVFTVVVTPTASGCAVTKTVAINYVSLSTPVIMAVPQMCNNGSGQQVFAFPQGGSFYSSQANSPIGLNSGIISPGLAQTGVNTFTYVASLGACSTSSVGSYTVNPAPTLTISGPADICTGGSLTWLTTGADTYSWSPAGPGTGSFAPTATTVYTVSATNTLGNCTSVVTKTLTVNPLPLVSVSGPSVACAGQYVLWTRSGATHYTITPAGPGPISFAAPAATTIYTITGAIITAPECQTIITKTLTIDPCTGIKSPGVESEIRVYPNPAVSEVIIETQLPLDVILYNELGAVIFEKNLESGRSVIDMSLYSSGVYLLKATSLTGVQLIKVVKVNQ